MSSEFSSYPIVGLSEIMDIQGGAQPPASTFKDVYEPGYVRFVQIRDFETDAHLTYIQQLPKWRYCSVDDVLIARYGASVGRICRGVSGAYNVALAKVIPKTGVDLKFLYYLLKSNFFQGPIAAMSGRSAQAGFNKEDLAAIRVPVPSWNVQSEIAAFLGCLDDRITLLRETNKTLEAIAQALFKSWFVDFDPVRAKIAGRQPEGMDEATAALFPDSFEESELGEIPQGWSYCSLKNVVEIFDSKRVPLSGSERSKRQGIYPYYGAAALMDYVDGYLFDGIYLLTGEDGSVADDCGNPITQYVWGKFWVNNHAHILQGNNGVSTEQLMLFLKRTNIQPYITGAVQAKLSQSNMWKINFLNPSRQISEAFGGVVKPLFDSLRQNADIANTLTNLRDALLPRLISGQLRLSEAEAEIEALTT
jgi:restriction endonuclease S subunit